MEILKHLIDCIMTITPILPYYAQINDFKRNKSSKGFSIKISLFILCSNILRIFFWFGERFNISLLIQSFLMIFMQFFLIKYYVKYCEKSKKEQKNFLKNFFTNFWDWDFLSNYYIFIAIFTFSLIISSMIFSFSNKFYVNLLGTISTFLEAIMPMAQVIKIFEEKSCANFSDAIIISWVLGDSFKACYYMETGLPMQFTLSAFMQVVVDLFIIIQIFYYEINFMQKEEKLIEILNYDDVDCDVKKND